MQVNSISNVYFGKKNKVNKDIGCGSNKLFRLPNNKEAKISKQYNAEINTLCKGVNCREAGVIELLKECEINYRNKFDRIIGKKMKLRRYKFGF